MNRWLRRSPAIFVLVAILASTCAKDEPIAPLVIPPFNSQNAFRYLQKQVALGPRAPGSPAHQKCLQFLSDSLGAYSDRIQLQSFSQKIFKTGEQVKLTNIISSFAPEKKNRVLLAAHWDTRPWADNDPDSSKHDEPVDGANDGASGVAVLLEVARVLKQNPPPVGVDIIFFDGEDFGIHGRDDTWAIGSQYFAKHKDVHYAPFIGILVDMVGDEDLHIQKETHSLNFAPDVVNLVWDYAARLELDAFENAVYGPVTDDHVPLLKVGIPCINIIDFDYEYWHTTQDTPDKCSPESLEQVGKAILAVLYNPPLT